MSYQHPTPNFTLTNAPEFLEIGFHDYKLSVVLTSGKVGFEVNGWDVTLYHPSEDPERMFQVTARGAVSYLAARHNVPLGYYVGMTFPDDASEIVTNSVADPRTLTPFPSNIIAIDYSGRVLSGWSEVEAARDMLANNPDEFATKYPSGLVRVVLVTIEPPLPRN
jgi:hypothetical protein